MDLSLSPVDSPTVSGLVLFHGVMRWSHLMSQVRPQLQLGLRILAIGYLSKYCSQSVSLPLGHLSHIMFGKALPPKF